VALYVVLLYIAVQTVESYLITPLIQRRAIAIPPGFLLAIQLIMGVAAGAFGLLLATPLAVVVMVLIKMLYLEDTLGDSITLPHNTLPQRQPHQQHS
jgi:predicted PurR-regulated permease PerM